MIVITTNVHWVGGDETLQTCLRIQLSSSFNLSSFTIRALMQHINSEVSFHFCVKTAAALGSTKTKSSNPSELKSPETIPISPK